MILNPYAFAAPATDPSFSSVKLLMGFEGANNSTTFTDESGSPHTMTAVGNAKIITAQQKFGASSGAFDGTGDYVSTPDSADWTLPLLFTVEGFFRFLVKQDSQAMLGHWDNAGTAGNSAWFFWINGGNLQFRFNVTTVTKDTSAAFAPTLGQWYHLAVDRDATSKVRLYRDGAMIGSANQNFVINNSTNVLTIGAIGTTGTFSSYDLTATWTNSG